MKASQVISYLQTVIDTSDCDPDVFIVLERDRCRYVDLLESMIASSDFVNKKIDVVSMRVDLVGESYTWGENVESGKKNN